MSSTADERLARLEDRMLWLQKRLERLEGQIAEQAPAEPPRAASPPPVTPPVAPPPVARPRSIEPKPKRDLEELLGGRLLALVGGVAVLVGLAFLVALAVERGWLDEKARTGLAFFGSAALLGVGVWLYERRGRTQASLAACGTGIAGLFLSLTAATVLYDLVPVSLALVAAFVVGALGAALAIRWDATPIGGLGLLGAVGAPILTGATQDVQALVFLAVAESAAVAVLTWRRWEWLRVGTVALVLAQLAFWVLDADPSRALGYGVLGLFGVLNLCAALGFELRRPTQEGRVSTAVLLGGNAAALAGLGPAIGSTGWWLAGLAVAHVAAGLALLRLQQENRLVALELFGIGLVLANIAFVVLVSGLAIPIGWAAAAAALALPARALSRRAQVVYAVVGAQLTLAALHVLVYDAPLDHVAHNTDTSIWPVLAIGLSALAVARLTPAEELEWRAAMDATALLALAYGTAVLLAGVALPVAWALEAIVLVEVGRRLEHQVAAAGAVGLMLLAALHALSFEARPDALVDGADPFWKAAVALAAVSAAAAFASLRSLPLFEHDRLVFVTASGTSLLYLASIGIVSAFQPGTGLATSGGLSVREQGQAILSGFWSLLGLALLWAGLRRELRPLRLAGFALLAVAVGKVFFYDMAALERGYRVLSLVVLGLFLLAGAYAYQRLRRDGGTRVVP
jgi:uncharacterized membrane protein